MVAYTQQELVGSTELVKSLGGFIDKIVSGTLEKIAIIRHNKPEAVIVPIAQYERMKMICDIAEDMEIDAILAQRMPEGKVIKTIPLAQYLESRREKGLYVPN